LWALIPVLGRVRFRAVRTGAVKRLVFLVGVVVLSLGTLILMDPVSVGDHNCGTAVAPKKFVQTDVRLCEAQIRQRRWLGAVILVVGAVALILPGPRCLLADD
jgi:hypothetical protein